MLLAKRAEDSPLSLVLMAGAGRSYNDLLEKVTTLDLLRSFE